MVTTLGPLAIFIAAVATVALAFVSFRDAITAAVLRFLKRFSTLLDRAGIRRPAEELFIQLVTAAAVLWIAGILVLRPNPIAGVFMIAIAALLTGGGFLAYVEFSLHRRVHLFVDQLEVVLRLMASGLRSGLGLRQTLSMVVDEASEPSKYEYARVIAQTNVGASVYDALDDLAERMKTNDSLMMARVIRIQSQTGGDLAKILEQLANTIKERRRMIRKIDALTAESRAGAAILALLPPLLGTYILLTQPAMGQALLFTPIGHIVLLIVAALEFLGIVTLMRILKVNV